MELFAHVLRDGTQLLVDSVDEHAGEMRVSRLTAETLVDAIKEHTAELRATRESAKPLVDALRDHTAELKAAREARREYVNILLTQNPGHMDSFIAPLRPQSNPQTQENAQHEERESDAPDDLKQVGMSNSFMAVENDIQGQEQGVEVHGTVAREDDIEEFPLTQQPVSLPEPTRFTPRPSQREDEYSQSPQEESNSETHVNSKGQLRTPAPFCRRPSLKKKDGNPKYRSNRAERMTTGSRWVRAKLATRGESRRRNDNEKVNTRALEDITRNNAVMFDFATEDAFDNVEFAFRSNEENVAHIQGIVRHNGCFACRKRASEAAQGKENAYTLYSSIIDKCTHVKLDGRNESADEPISGNDQIMQSCAMTD